jgi:ubiquinone/menaquinone biosynthesis C-methylase UbiE
MIDQDKLTEASRGALARGIRVLQGCRLDKDDREHMAILLGHMAPDQDSTWVDIGCGFGEPVRLLRELRPDLRFWLVNNNSFQLSQAPPDVATFCCDMHELPFDEASFDGAMFLYSLCQSDGFVHALREAWRVVRPGGKLFVFDCARFGAEDDALSLQHLGARFIPFDSLRVVNRVAGWDLEAFLLPQGSNEVFRSMFIDPELHDRIFSGVRPIIWWARRR